MKVIVGLGNPGDNYGDGGGGSWTFCWQITVKECPPADNGASLVMEITNYFLQRLPEWFVIPLQLALSWLR